MRSVNVATLKNRLSHYLREVRRGEEILIRDRNVPIARIVPLSATETDADAELMELAAAGLVRLPERDWPGSFFSMPGPRISVKEAVAVGFAERDEEDLNEVFGHEGRSPAILPTRLVDN